MASKKKTAPAAEQTADSSTAATETVTTAPTTLREATKMDAKVKARWVEKLRSGDIKQATGVLNAIAQKGKNEGKSTGMCCLGVLCDIFSRSKANVNKLKWETEDDYDFETDQEITAAQATFDGEEGMPTEVVAKWAGFPADKSNIYGQSLVVDPLVEIAPLWANKKFNAKLKKGNVKKKGSSGDGLVSLSELNDTKVFTFKDIADIIETYL